MEIHSHFARHETSSKDKEQVVVPAFWSSPSHEKKNIGGETPTDVIDYSAVPDGRGRAWVARRTSIGVPPRLSSQGVFHRKGLSTRLLLPGTWRPGLACPSGGRYPLLPVPVQRGHRAPVVVP